MQIRTICCWGLLALPVMSEAAILASGDILNFSTAAGSQVSGIAGGGTVFDGASLDSLNGLKIGDVQPSYPDIDQQWASTQFGVIGNHSTTSAVIVLSGSELDFSGWTMSIGGEAYNFGATQKIANYTSDGINYTLDYHWNAASDNNGIGLGSLNVTSYTLTLAGSVSSVPIPAAAWLFGSALLGLGVVKRKKA